MRAVFIGSVQFSERLLKVVHSTRGMQVVGVVTKETSTFSSDFLSLKTHAQKDCIDCFLFDNQSKSRLYEWITSRAPDVVFCLGWSHLLDEKLLKAVPEGVIGYHPAALPQNRGRHPIIWALCLGLKETASTFFVMDEGVDSGDIVSQVKVKITAADTAATLYKKLNNLAEKQLVEICRRLVAQKLKRIPQAHAKASYWRKRTGVDGKIDWRMSTTTILNLIRALTRPYPGAFFSHSGKDYKVWRAAKSSVINKPNWEPGKVLKSEKGKLTVKTGDGFLHLLEHDFSGAIKVGDCLL